MTSKISFIVNINNNKAYLKQAFESFQRIEGNFRSEFIIIDYASTDDSLNLAKSYSKALPRATIISCNQNESNDTLKGLMIANGDYVSFLRGDIIVNPHSHNNLLELIKSYNKSIALGIGTFEKTYRAANPSLNNLKPDIAEVNLLNYLIDNQKIINITTPNSLIKRSLLEEAQGASKDFLYQELDLFLECATKTEVVITTEQVYFCPSEGGDILYNTDPASILITLKKLLKLSPDFVKLHLKRLYLITQDLERVRNNSIVLGLRNLSNRLFTPKISLNDLEANIDLALKKNP